MCIRGTLNRTIPLQFFWEQVVQLQFNNSTRSKLGSGLCSRAKAAMPTRQQWQQFGGGTNGSNKSKQDGRCILLQRFDGQRFVRLWSSNVIRPCNVGGSSSECQQCSEMEAQVCFGNGEDGANRCFNRGRWGDSIQLQSNKLIHA